jgi:hypothetical protein
MNVRAFVPVLLCILPLVIPPAQLDKLATKRAQGGGEKNTKAMMNVESWLNEPSHSGQSM